MKTIELKFKKLNDKAKDPIFSTNGAAGCDIFCTEFRSSLNYIEYNTSIAFEIPEGYVGLLFPRSSITKTDLMLANAVGVIDSDYRGEVTGRFKIVKNYNPGFFYNGHNETYKEGDRILQLVLVEIPKVTLKEVDELSTTERGTGGYGSTGK